MTTEAILRKSVRYDRVGNPVEVVIPYEEFVDFIETYGLDLTDDEKESIAEAKADREAGRAGNSLRSRIWRKNSAFNARHCLSPPRCALSE